MEDTDTKDQMPSGRMDTVDSGEKMPEGKMDQGHADVEMPAGRMLHDEPGTTMPIGKMEYEPAGEATSEPPAEASESRSKPSRGKKKAERPGDEMLSGNVDTSDFQYPPAGGKLDDIELPTRRKCATMDVHRRLLSEVAGYAEARDRIENHTLEVVRKATETARTGVVRIAVVVHVVWNTAAQNISDAQIQSQIVVLNRDFRKLNSDISQVPGVWTGFVADAEIEFFLATTDPSGN